MKFKMEIIARNIVNPEAITDFISKVSKNQSDKIKIWCNTILKNYLKNEYDNLKEVTKSKKSDPAWLQEAVKRKDAQKIIIEKEFERLLVEHIFHYFNTLQGTSINQSFPEAQKQTKEWENKENLFNIKLTKGVKEILKCEGGYTWFEITDKETLYNEGEVLQNCMRKKEHGPEYWEEIKKKEIKIFTLRDSRGIGHVGVEYSINNKYIRQMYGKQNDNPIEIYHHSCIELIKFLKCKVHKNIVKFLNIIVIGKQIYDIFNLPDNLKIKGNLDLRGTKIIKLPEGLNIDGNLDLSYTKIKKLPNLIKIGKSLNLVESSIISLPNNLIIGELLNLNSTKIKYLPKNLKVQFLDISFTRITTLPKDLKVKQIYVEEGRKLIGDKKLLDKIIEDF